MLFGLSCTCRASVLRRGDNSPYVLLFTVLEVVFDFLLTDRLSIRS
jgi:hypothetical protein